ncbi:MAG: Dabb family protein [Candidatus Solibacter usitatus]|nr:Dabb family protein [Candidatus Solibacter usitatus]
MQTTVRLRQAVSAAVVLVALGATIGVAANKYGKPKTIVHVVTLYYKDGTTEEQKKTVLEGIEKMAGEVPGIRNVWLKSVKVQGSVQIKDAEGKLVNKNITDAFVMEFENEAAFKAYDDHPAHRAWEKVYVPLRGQSRSYDITNQ